MLLENARGEVALIEDYPDLMKNHPYYLISPLKGHKLLNWKWVYRTKYATNGFVEKHKVCLMAKGFS